MKWGSSVSEHVSIGDAVREASDALRGQLQGHGPDLLFAFISPHHAAQYERLPDLLGKQFPEALLVGCSGGGVIGGACEVERRPGLSLTGAWLPGVTLQPLRVEAEAFPQRGGAAEWRQAIGVAAEANPQLVVLPDPFSCDAEALVAGLDLAYPAAAKVGGLASGARQPGGNALFLGRESHRAGLVGVALSGDVVVDTIVAQGCRPIGEPMFVTTCERNLLYSLDGDRALDVLHDLHGTLGARDRELFQHSLFLGVAMSDEREEYRQGDFLIRNLIGVDSDSGALAVGAILGESSVVQFHLRDAHTSAEDLQEMLADYAGRAGDDRPLGALLFSCLGRGDFLYGRPDHDTGMFLEHVGQVPLGGFFCNGEIGPVHGVTFLHGYTSAFGLFRPQRRS